MKFENKPYFVFEKNSKILTGKGCVFNGIEFKLRCFT